MIRYDAIIVGGGPAGLTAAIYLGRARREVLLLSKGLFESTIIDVEGIENYPGFAEPVTGSYLLNTMVEQVMKCGVAIEDKNVVKIGSCGGGFCVACADDTEIMGDVVIVASGTSRKRLGVRGEERFTGKGVFYCAFCEGERYRGAPVVVCGGGDAGVSEAMYMDRIASQVTLVEAMPRLTATAILQERLEEHPGIKVMCGVRIEGIVGETAVTAIEYRAGDQRGILETNGVLVQIGRTPNAGVVRGLVRLDETSHIIVNQKMETSVVGLLAAGDVRSESGNQIVTATGDGATAAITAERWLQTQK